MKASTAVRTTLPFAVACDTLGIRASSSAESAISLRVGLRCAVRRASCELTTTESLMECIVGFVRRCGGQTALRAGSQPGLQSAIRRATCPATCIAEGAAGCAPRRGELLGGSRHLCAREHCVCVSCSPLSGVRRPLLRLPRREHVRSSNQRHVGRPSRGSGFRSRTLLLLMWLRSLGQLFSRGSVARERRCLALMAEVGAPGSPRSPSGLVETIGT